MGRFFINVILPLACLSECVPGKTIWPSLLVTGDSNSTTGSSGRSLFISRQPATELILQMLQNFIVVAVIVVVIVVVLVTIIISC